MSASTDIEKAKQIKLRLETQEAVNEVLRRQNKGFAQVYDKGFGKLLYLLTSNIKNGSGAVALWLLIAKHMDREGAVAMSQTTIAEMLGCDVRTVRRYVAVLEKEKMIFVMRAGGASGGFNIYALDPAQAWKWWDDKKEQAVFHTKTIIGKQDGAAMKKQLRVLLPTGKLPKRRTKKQIREERLAEIITTARKPQGGA